MDVPKVPKVPEVPEVPKVPEVQEQPFRIISFDVGMKNMCYCVLEVGSLEESDPTIREWDIMPVPQGANVPDTCENLIAELDKRPFLSGGNFVVIENQPVTKNPKMKTLQIVLMSYFLGKKRLETSPIQEVMLLNSALKLKAYEGPPLSPTTKSKSAYVRRKNLVILYCQHELRENAEHLAFLKSHKKKDDLSDAFLQALYVIRKTDRVQALKTA